VDNILIVMPTYNQGQYIAETINSILSQIYAGWRLIVVDDFSTDNTLDILNHFVDPRITIIRHTENRGTGAAINYGLWSAAKWGWQWDYETWFASDNRMYPQMLERLHANATNADFIYSGYHYADIKENTVKDSRTWLRPEYSKDRLYNESYYLGICWLWRKSLREKVGEFQVEPCEDYDFALRCEEAGGRFKYVPEILGWYRYHTGNKTQQIRDGGDWLKYEKLINERAKVRRGL
jgi:glycosyltransferase involved in cell wall biosynthesis